MKYIWALLCQTSSIDRNNNLLSIFNCVEELVLTTLEKKLPKGKEFVIPINIQLISFWVVEDYNKENLLDTRTELLDPNGKRLGHMDKKINIAKGVKRFRNITNIKTLKITKEGRYTIKLSQRKENDKNLKTVVELPIDIKIIYK